MTSINAWPLFANLIGFPLASLKSYMEVYTPLENINPE
nr:MAG TPA: hypothetical protein [Caudoviricetes sp.]